MTSTFIQLGVKGTCTGRRHISWEKNLVGGWPTPLKNMNVNGEDYPIYYGTQKMFETTNQNMATGFDVCNQTIDGFAGPSSW